MAHLADKIHFDWHHFDRRKLARFNSAILIGAIGGGLAVCVLGAAAYDLEQLFSNW